MDYAQDVNEFSISQPNTRRGYMLLDVLKGTIISGLLINCYVISAEQQRKKITRFRSAIKAWDKPSLAVGSLSTTIILLMAYFFKGRSQTCKIEDLIQQVHALEQSRSLAVQYPIQLEQSALAESLQKSINEFMEGLRKIDEKIIIIFHIQELLLGEKKIYTY